MLNKKIFTLIAVFTLLTIVLNQNFIISKSLSNSCNDNLFFVGGIGPGNFTNIQEAIDSSTKYATIYVYDDSSPYFENIVIKDGRKITLIGENKQTTIIDGMGTKDVINVFSCCGTHAELDINGFTIQNSGSNIPDDAGIELMADNCIISNVIINDNNGCGILLSNSADNNLIDITTIENNSYCGILMKNVFTNQITNNKIKNNNGNGILLDKSYDIQINGNCIENNHEAGLKISDSHDNIIYENDLRNHSSIGILLDNQSNDNQIYNNNLINNIIQAEDRSNNQWSNQISLSGNYWSDYQQKYQNAEPNDYYWDIPYEIPGNDNFDDYPLLFPLGFENRAPNKPTIDGPESGNIEIEYEFTTNTNDPDGDQIYYIFDWGDGTISDWIGPYDSLNEVTISHQWQNRGNYGVKVKAKDIYYYESDWSETLSMNIFKFKRSEYVFQKIIQNTPILSYFIEFYLKSVGIIFHIY